MVEDEIGGKIIPFPSPARARELAVLRAREKLLFTQELVRQRVVNPAAQNLAERLRDQLQGINPVPNQTAIVWTIIIESMFGRF